MNRVETVAGDRKRIVWVLGILLLGGFLATSLIGYRVAHDSISSQITDSALPLTSDNIYSEIQRDLLRPIFIASLMAQDTFLRDWTLDGEADAESMIRYLREIQARYGTVTSFFVSERTRRYYHPTGVLKTVTPDSPADAWYFRTRDLRTGDDYEVNIDSDTADRAATNVFVNYRVYDYSGNVIGVAGVGLAVDVVRRLIEVYQRRYGRRVYFVDRSGEVKLHGADFDGPLRLAQRVAGQALATRILTSPGGSYDLQRDGDTVYLNSRLLPEFGWYLVVEQERDAAQERLFETLLVNLLLSLAVTGAVLVLAQLTLRRYQRRLEEMATQDKLTGAMNRQIFETVYEKALLAARREGGTASVIMLDIDHFKRINDAHGHLHGDQVLRRVAAIVMSCVREADSVCRWGGEEFVVLLPGCPYDQTLDLAERIRVEIARSNAATMDATPRVTASMGVAETDGVERPIALIDRADRALYRAKHGGRNAVCGDPAQRPPAVPPTRSAVPGRRAP